MKSRLRQAFTSCICALFCALGAQTAWPEKSVTVIAPFPAAGATDATAGAMATQTQAMLGQAREFARWKTLIKTRKINLD